MHAFWFVARSITFSMTGTSQVLCSVIWLSQNPMLAILIRHCYKQRDVYIFPAQANVVLNHLPIFFLVFSVLHISPWPADSFSWVERSWVGLFPELFVQLAKSSVALLPLVRSDGDDGGDGSDPPQRLVLAHGVSTAREGTQGFFIDCDRSLWRHYLRYFSQLEQSSWGRPTLQMLHGSMAPGKQYVISEL